LTEAEYDSKSATWMALSRIAALCNTAQFKPDQENIPVIDRCVYFYVHAAFVRIKLMMMMMMMMMMISASFCQKPASAKVIIKTQHYKYRIS